MYIEILSLTNGLVIIYLFSHRIGFLYASVAIALLCIFIPRFAQLLGMGLHKIIQALGAVTNRLILTIVYIFFLTPIALLQRAFRKKKDIATGKNSFFITRDYKYKPDDFSRQG